MKITANLATWSARRNDVNKAIDSLINQVDKVRVYYNDYTPEKRSDIIQFTGEDLTDRGKFYGITDNEIAFTCDDDIKYPDNYVVRTLDVLKKYPNAVITYHGRTLKGKGLNYYFHHEMFHCLRTHHYDTFIDVAGTGVSCFDASKWKPDVLQYRDQNMSDVLFSLECAKANRKIICASHQMGWFEILTNEGAIFNTESRRCDRQNEYADLIWDLRYS